MIVTWIIGQGGMLGAAVRRELDSSGSPVIEANKVNWGTYRALDDLKFGLENFLSAVGSGTWRIIWCAGSGVTSSRAEDFQEENAIFASFLSQLSRSHLPLHAKGTFLYCSSAGAVYGGSVNPPFSEQSVPIPLGDYGKSKLASEKEVEILARNTKVKTAIARISNLYGPGQRLEKQQGILSQLAKSSLTRNPLSIYVPLDTLRDYIFVDDCAKKIVAMSNRVHESSDSDSPHVKIIASGKAISLGAVIGEFKRLRGNKPPVVMRHSGLSALQSKDLRLQSNFWTDIDAVSLTNLHDGIFMTRSDIERKLLQPGFLA